MKETATVLRLEPQYFSGQVMLGVRWPLSLYRYAARTRGFHMIEFFSRLDWPLFVLVSSVIVVWARHALGLAPAAAPCQLLIANGHWIVHGVGAFLYPDRDLFTVFDLRLGTIAWLLIATILLIWGSLLRWLFIKDGAELLADSQAVRRSLNLPSSPASIRFMALVCFAGGVVGLSGIVHTATGG